MHFALKKLTRSDLTFFEYQFRRQNAGNQKSINLNANVFVDLIFPLARDVAAGQPKQFAVPVSIYGPGLRAVPHRIARKVIAAGGSQKNWRLNGEFVVDPEFDLDRYHQLAADDLALFGFEGDHGLPSNILIVLISVSEPGDAGIHDRLMALLAGRRMMEVSPQELSGVVDISPAGHPIRELLEVERDEALEEAALGSADGIRRLLQQPSTRRMGADALAKAKERAATIGRDGELIVDVFLRMQVREGLLKQATWVSEENAVSPWDFEAIENDDTHIRIEVKSTVGQFERKLHISHAEILAAAHADAPRTDLYRVYALAGDDAWLQISRNVREVASHIVKKASELGDDIVPDGYSVSPHVFPDWIAAERLQLIDEEDES